MDAERARALAGAYWADPGGDDWAELLGHADENSADLPRLLAALVETVPVDRSISFIGTGPIEDLYHGGASGEDVVTVLRSARFDAPTIAGILSGVWPDLLDEMGMREHLEGLLPTSQIDWLLDPHATDRGASL